MLGHTGFRRLSNHRLWNHRRRGLLAVVGTVLALTGIAIALVPPPPSQAATGQRWSTGIQHVGILNTNTGSCSVTVVSEWLAITSKRCGRVNPRLQLDVSTPFNPGVVGIKSIEVNRDLDVEALLLQKRTGLGVTPIRGFVTPHDRLSFWGYGFDTSNSPTDRLTRADFDGPTACPSILKPEYGTLCWATTDTNSVCTGDLGGPVLQNGAIVGMLTGAESGSWPLPDGSPDCSKIRFGTAIKVQEMRTWLDQMITDADPFD